MNNPLLLHFMIFEEFYKQLKFLKELSQQVKLNFKEYLLRILKLPSISK